MRELLGLSKLGSSYSQESRDEAAAELSDAVEERFKEYVETKDV